MTELEELEARELLQQAIANKDEAAELRAREMLADDITFSAFEPVKEEKEGSALVGAGEAALSVATGGASMAATGLAAPIVAATDPNISAFDVSQVVDETVASSTYQPRTKEGQKTIKTIRDLANEGVDLTRVPLSKLGFWIERLTGQTMEQAQSVETSIQEKGLGRTMADSVIDQGGGPELATAVGMLPEALLSTPVIRAPAALQGISNKIKNTVDDPDIVIFDDSGQFTEAAIQKLEKLDAEKKAVVGEAVAAGAVLTSEQARRLNLFQERGVPALKADITRDTADSIAQQQRIKEGEGKPAIIAAEQEAALTRAVEEGIEGTGAVAIDAEEMGTAVAGVIKNRATELDSQITQAYAAAKQSAQGQAVVDLSGYVEFVKSQRGKENITGGVLTSAMTDLRNNGLIGKDANTMVTVEVAERLRQGLNANFSGAKPPGKVMIRQLKDEIDNDVIGAVGEDVFGDARAAKIRFEAAIKKSKRDKFDVTKGSLVEDILSNKIEEDKIFEHILKRSTRSDDIVKLREFLVKEGGEEGLQAWFDIKGQVLRHALDQALGTLQIREGGKAAFNVNKFRNEIKRLRGKKYDVLFNADEKKLIADITEIGMARIPIQGTALGEGATSIAVKRAAAQVRADLMKRIPLVGEGAQGLIDFVSNRRLDKDLTQFTKETEKALRKQ